MKTKLLLILILLFASSCKQDPYLVLKDFQLPESLGQPDVYINQRGGFRGEGLEFYVFDKTEQELDDLYTLMLSNQHIVSHPTQSTQNQYNEMLQQLENSEAKDKYAINLSERTQALQFERVSGTHKLFAIFDKNNSQLILLLSIS